MASKNTSARKSSEPSRSGSRTPAVTDAAVSTGKKRSTRLQYYEGVRQAMMQHVATTEEMLRNLDGARPSKIDNLIADLRKTHDKLVKRIDRQIKRQLAPSS